MTNFGPFSSPEALQTRLEMLTIFILLETMFKKERDNRGAQIFTRIQEVKKPD